MTKFRVKVKVKDDRKSNIQHKSVERAYDSPFAKARREQRKQRAQADYKPPKHGKRQK